MNPNEAPPTITRTQLSLAQTIAGIRARQAAEKAGDLTAQDALMDAAAGNGVLPPLYIGTLRTLEKANALLEAAGIVLDQFGEIALGVLAFTDPDKLWLEVQNEDAAYLEKLIHATTFALPVNEAMVAHRHIQKAFKDFAELAAQGESDAPPADAPATPGKPTPALTPTET